MSDIEKASSSQDSIQAQAVSLQLMESDIPGALLNDPIERHTMFQLRWWLMCRGIKNILGSEASLHLVFSYRMLVGITVKPVVQQLGHLLSIPTHNTRITRHREHKPHRLKLLVLHTCSTDFLTSKFQQRGADSSLSRHSPKWYT